MAYTTDNNSSDRPVPPAGLAINWTLPGGPFSGAWIDSFTQRPLQLTFPSMILLIDRPQVPLPAGPLADVNAQAGLTLTVTAAGVSQLQKLALTLQEGPSGGATQNLAYAYYAVAWLPGHAPRPMIIAADVDQGRAYGRALALLNVGASATQASQLTPAQQYYVNLANSLEIVSRARAAGLCGAAPLQQFEPLGSYR